MKSYRLSEDGHIPRDIGRHGGARWFAGLTWKGVALIALLCIINAVRRAVPYTFGELPISALLIKFVQDTAYGLIVAVPVALAVVSTYNLAPRGATLRYTSLALALVVSCMASIAVAVVVEALGNGECSRSLEACFNDLSVSAFIPSWTRYGSLCVLFAVVFVYLRVADKSAADEEKADRDRARFVQRMEEARLRMLQAQIEPHFLF